MIWIRIAALNGFVAVAAGAFGAHALKERLAPDKLEVFETAARYQMYHALALLVVGGLCVYFPSQAAAAAGWLFLTGIIIFSGSLYAYVLTAIKTFALITPAGGLSLLAGWLALLLATFSPTHSPP